MFNILANLRDIDIGAIQAQVEAMAQAAVRLAEAQRRIETVVMELGARQETHSQALSAIMKRMDIESDLHRTLLADLAPIAMSIGTMEGKLDRLMAALGEAAPVPEETQSVAHGANAARTHNGAIEPCADLPSI